MANNFNITISAIDKTAKTVRNINNSFSKMLRPVTNLKRSFGALGAEIGRNPVAKAMGGIAKAAGGAAMVVARVAAPMAALTGVSTIAGVAMLATEWGKLGFEVSKTSTALDVTTSDLQSLRGAAQLAGVSTDSLDGSLKSLGDTMQDALMGRNQNAMILMNKLGVSVRRTADGSVDAVQGFKDMANWIAKTKNVQAQNIVARAFGLEAALPLLRKGAAGIEEYQRKIAEFGGVSTQQGIKAAEDFGLNLAYLKAAGNGLKISIGSALLPVMQELTTSLTGFITENRKAISDNIGAWAKDFGTWLKTVDFKALIKDIKEFCVIVFKAVEIVAKLIVKLAGLKAGQPDYLGQAKTWGPGKWNPQLTPNSGESKGPSVSGKVNYGTPGPLTNSGAQSPIANSGGMLPKGIRTNNPLNIQPNGRQGVYGSMEEGLQAGIGNIQRNYQGLTLAKYVRKYAPGNGKGNTPASEAGYLAYLSQQTGVKPNEVPNLNDPKVLAPLVSAQVRHENGGKGYDKDAMDAAIQKVVVEFKNAPPGTRATAKNDRGTDAPVKVNYAMPTLSAG